MDQRYEPPEPKRRETVFNERAGGFACETLAPEWPAQEVEDLDFGAALDLLLHQTGVADVKTAFDLDH